MPTHRVAPRDTVTVGDEFEQQLGARLAAELVGAGVDDLDHALARREVLDAPGAGGERLAEDLGVVDEAPVGADDAVEAERSRSRPVMTDLLKPKPTSSYSVPTGMP